MKKAVFALLTAATFAAGSVAMAPQAEARGGGAVAAGLLGGLAAGAIIGGAIANSQPRYYGPPRGYVVYDDYYAEAPYGCPDGYWARRPVAFDRWGNPVRWSRPRYICP